MHDLRDIRLLEESYAFPECRLLLPRTFRIIVPPSRDLGGAGCLNRRSYSAEDKGMLLPKNGQAVTPQLRAACASGSHPYRVLCCYVSMDPKFRLLL
jgi:hypothetical protein